jgi:hypothetical protein
MPSGRSSQPSWKAPRRPTSSNWRRAAGSASVVVTAHAFIQNLRRGHYDLGTDVPPAARVANAFVELALRRIAPVFWLDAACEAFLVASWPALGGVLGASEGATDAERLPAGGDHPGGPMVPALRPVLRDVEELLAERGIDVDHVTMFRWVQRFAPELIEAASARRHLVGDRWHVDETYVKVAGTWRYLFRAIDQFGQVIDVFLSRRRDREAARRFFDRATAATRISPVEVTADGVPGLPSRARRVAPCGLPPHGGPR